MYELSQNMQNNNNELYAILSHSQVYNHINEQECGLNNFHSTQ